MNRTYHFISGLPRSGSTLLSSILKQNPRFTSGISDPIALYCDGIIRDTHVGAGMGSTVSIEERKEIIRGIFDSFYSDSSEVCFNTNRGWASNTALLSELYPNFKMIVCVRSLPWILDSFETLVRKNALSTTTMFAPEENVNVYSRSHTLMRPDKPVGFAFDGIKQALTSNEKSSIYVLEYDKLAKRPEQTMKEIYQFIGKPYYKHDYDNVEVSYDEFDDDVQLKGLHTTRKKVSYVDRQLIIPPDLAQQYSNYEFWRQIK